MRGQIIRYTKRFLNINRTLISKPEHMRYLKKVSWDANRLSEPILIVNVSYDAFWLIYALHLKK